MRSRVREMFGIAAIFGVAALAMIALPSSSAADRSPGVDAIDRSGELHAGVLLPKRTKLIIDYKRVEIA